MYWLFVFGFICFFFLSQEIVIVYGIDPVFAVGVCESVAVIVNEDPMTELGLPEITPVAPFKDSPAGNEPEVIV